MIRIACFASMRSEDERVCAAVISEETQRKTKLTESSRLSPVVQAGHIGIHVIHPVVVVTRQFDYSKMITVWMCSPVRKWGVLTGVPQTREREFTVDPAFRLGFIIYTVKANNSLQEDMKLRV